MVDSSRGKSSAPRLEAKFSLISISQNEIQKRFAGWAASSPSRPLIAGVYGMNFRVHAEFDWLYGYPFTLSLTVL
jgi:magnesium transporter